MADNINKVTIDAAWFAELYAKWIAKPTFSERMVADGAQAIRENKELRKERDELKANLKKLADFCESNKCVGDNCVLHDRLAAAERCIEECFGMCNKRWNATAEIANHIRAYREAKGDNQ